MSETNLQSFSGLQFYLAHAQNTVHVSFEVQGRTNEADFEDLTRLITEMAPQVLWEELIEAGGYRAPSGATDLHEVMSVEIHSDRSSADEALFRRLMVPFNDTGKPAFRAILQNIGATETGWTSRLVFQTSHGILEGGDVAGVLRGRSARHMERPIVASGLSVMQRFGSWAIVPVLWPIHMLLAATEKRDPKVYRFERFCVKRKQLKAVATKLGVGQRDLLFAMSSEAFRQTKYPGKRLTIAYSTLPSSRAQLVDDDYLNVRMDDVVFRAIEDAAAYTQHVSAELRKRGQTPMFVATYQRKLVRLHQWLHKRAGWIYPKSFFGFAPQHLILSMLPPTKPERFSGILGGASVHAGSNTGTANCCIFVPTDDTVGITFWTEVPSETLHRAMVDFGTRVGLEIERPGLESSAAPLSEAV